MSKAIVAPNQEQLYNLAQKFEERAFQSKDPEESQKMFEKMLELYERAADLGHIPSRHNLAVRLHLNGDISSAIYHYKIAANAGYDCSQCNLGTIYVTDGSNHTEGLRYLELAAEQNNRTATKNLISYYKGELVDGISDPAKVEEYTKKLAILPGDDASIDFDVVLPRSTPRSATATETAGRTEEKFNSRP